MQLGVFTVLFQNLPFDAMVEKVQDLGLEFVEIGTGAYAGGAHCDIDRLLDDPAALRHYSSVLAHGNLRVSALACQGNPLHPNLEIASEHRTAFEKTVRLAERLDVEVINLLSGCPGDSLQAKYPNWASCAWPPDYPELLKWQWEEVAIPYWRSAAEFAAQHGIRKLAIEMHPGFLVYNPETLLRLRRAVGESIGCNFDPSHLWWLGIDVPLAIKELGREGALYHCHAKDVLIDRFNTARNGCLDTKPYPQVKDRSWTFRSVGWGHDLAQWREIATAFRLAEYDYVMSIEHEDPLASVDEGLRHSVLCLRQALLVEPAGEAYWA